MGSKGDVDAVGEVVSLSSCERWEETTVKMFEFSASKACQVSKETGTQNTTNTQTTLSNEYPRLTEVGRVVLVPRAGL